MKVFVNTRIRQEIAKQTGHTFDTVEEIINALNDILRKEEEK